MKNLLQIIVGLLLLANFAFAQAPTIQWQNTIGGSATEELYSIVQTADGGYVLGGYSMSNISGDKTENSWGVSDYWIVKTDSLGNIQWQNTIGGSQTDSPHSTRQTSDGGFILGGISSSSISGDKTENTNGGYDYWIVKTDSAGNIQWQNTIGGSTEDQLESMQQTTDGGYILGGYSNSNISGDKTENSNGLYDYWIVKTDSLGNIQWQNTIGGSDWDELRTMTQTADGGFLLGGLSRSNISGDKTENTIGFFDYWIVKTDSAGNVLWDNTIGGSSDDWLNSMKQTTDGGYTLAGTSNSPASGDKTENSIGNFDYWIVKTDGTGNIQWQNTIGGTIDDRLWSVNQTADGGYILGGQSTSNISGDKTENSNGGADNWIIKIDSTGSIVWQNSIGGAIHDWPHTIQQTADGGYIVGGHSTSNISGDKTENTNGGQDWWIYKLSPDFPTTISSNAPGTNNILFYPNPASTELTIINNHSPIINVEIFNTLGENVYTNAEGFRSNAETINVSALSSGIYFVRVWTSEGISAGKFVKE